jgi:hypothetical protein
MGSPVWQYWLQMTGATGAAPRNFAHTMARKPTMMAPIEAQNSMLIRGAPVSMRHFEWN